MLLFYSRDKLRPVTETYDDFVCTIKPQHKFHSKVESDGFYFVTDLKDWFDALATGQDKHDY